MGQGAESVDPEIPRVENQLDQQMESWDVGNHHVDHKDPETVDLVSLVTEIVVPAPENVVLATVNADQVGGNLGPVTRIDHSPVKPLKP